MDESANLASRPLFLGEGEMPADFDRPNWGAALFIYIWLWLYGFRRWAVGVTLVYLGLLVVENLVLLFVSAQLPFERYQYWAFLVSMPFWWVAQVYFGLNVNRLLWQREQARFSAAAGDPVHPIPLLRFEKSTRFWTVLGLSLVGLGLVSWVALVALGRESGLGTLTSFPPAAVPLLAIFLTSRFGRRRAS